jgi:hypothetical protein
MPLGIGRLREHARLGWPTTFTIKQIRRVDASPSPDFFEEPP